MFKAVGIILLPILLISSCQEPPQPATTGPETDTVWMKKGDSIISQTFDTLRNTLLRAIAEKGYPGAVVTCNSQALQLTASFARQGMMVKRTSAWLRNPLNAPDSLETLILEAYGQTLHAGQTLKPRLLKDPAGNRHYFKPIMMQAMCLSCHGIPGIDISRETNAVLKQYYPADQAIHFREGNWRGIWHITFYKR